MMSESIENQKITFREAGSGDELLGLLKLRYEVYRDSQWFKMLSDGSATEARIDIDQFDPYSHHFGLFVGSPEGEEEVIGYLRIATNELQPRNSAIAELIGEIAAPVVKYPDFTYPIQTHTNASSVVSFLEIQNQNGSSLVEPSRLSIRSEWRCIRTSVFLLECSIAWWLRASFDAALLSCAKSQERAYQRYGFRPISEEELFIDVRCAIPSAQMYLRPEFIPSYRRNRLDAMACELEVEGRISLSVRKSESALTSASKTTRIENAQIQEAKVA
jgi:Acetyltransferase (GNAT) domain